ncbi:MAG: hypothetical protein M1352_00640 [Patescibacteria group bacterium]|nr:hypothetical protein [Patescibacteria group bacterium]
MIKFSLKRLKSNLAEFVESYGFILLAGSLGLNVLLLVKPGFAHPASGRALLKEAPPTPAAVGSADRREKIFSGINPEKGYGIDAPFGNLGPQMIDLGVIDLTKFEDAYKNNGRELTDGELAVLTRGSPGKVKIDRQNAPFLLNFFWALGLANKSKILSGGQMIKYGKEPLGGFASTGGWTLGKGNALNYYADADLIPLTVEQEALVEKVASGVYRPCCDNPASFPDCNHGMALLGVLELLAGNGASESEMGEAAKYFNAFWFPENYYDLALYFQSRKGESFSQVSGQEILGRNYSSASGWQNIKKEIAQSAGSDTSRQSSSCGV